MKLHKFTHITQKYVHTHTYGAPNLEISAQISICASCKAHVKAVATPQQDGDQRGLDTFSP